MSHIDISPYEMAISLNAIKNLGINLYTSVPAVLSEVVANAWDADASHVNIEIGLEQISVSDDGVGMTREDLNNRFLLVGYDKRNDSDNPYARLTPKKRKPMGRKGIGKLSVFSVAHEIEVQTVKDGQSSGFVMKIEDILEALGDNRATTYRPEALPESSIEVKVGTRIIMRRLKKRTDQAARSLRRRLARRFSVLDDTNFAVSIDCKPVTVADRDYFDQVEFLWLLGEESASYSAHAPNITKIKTVDNEIDEGVTVTGWIGTVERPSAIKDSDTALVLMARGKLVQENLLRSLQETGIYAEYVVGEVNADFLDEDGDDDIVTSDRQRIKEDDPRVEKLFAFLEPTLARIRREWDQNRREVGVQKARRNPVLAEWLDQYKGDVRAHAETMLAKIETLRLPDEESKKELYRASIVGFERLALRDALSRLNKLETEQDFDLLKELFGDIDELEAFHYYQIIKSRLNVVEQFINILPEARERVVQEYLFDHLWLLDPSWERASVNARIEQKVTEEFGKLDAGLTDEEKEGRIDIRYQTAAGKHIIIELKRYKRKVRVLELVAQVEKYVTALEKVLTARFPNEPRVIEAICIIGEPPVDENDRNRNVLREYNARYITYDTLIKQTQDSYQEYLEGQRHFIRTLSLVDRLVDAEPSSEKLAATTH